MSNEEIPETWIDYLSRIDVQKLSLNNDEILESVEEGLRLQGMGEAVIEPRVHLEPGVSQGHFNVLRGSLGGSIDMAGVKVVGDFVDNYLAGLPSELALLNLMDRRTGMPKAVIDASFLTDIAHWRNYCTRRQTSCAKGFQSFGAHWRSRDCVLERTTA